MDKIKSWFTVVLVGAENNFGHPHRIAMNIYKEKTKEKRAYTTKDNKSMYFAFKNDVKLEYKIGLDFDELINIKHLTEDEIESVAGTLTFNAGEEIESELPRRPPRAKREGYFKENFN